MWALGNPTPMELLIKEVFDCDIYCQIKHSSFVHKYKYAFLVSVDWVTIRSGNDWAPQMRQVITWKNGDISLKWTFRTNTSDFLNQCTHFRSRNCILQCCVQVIFALRSLGPPRLILDWQYDCPWGMEHCLQLAGITLLWLVGLNIDYDCLVPITLWDHVTHRFSDPNDSPFAQTWRLALPVVRAVQGDCERVYAFPVISWRQALNAISVRGNQCNRR